MPHTGRIVFGHRNLRDLAPVAEIGAFLSTAHPLTAANAENLFRTPSQPRLPVERLDLRDQLIGRVEASNSERSARNSRLSR
jgi:hypothetical protein